MIRFDNVSKSYRTEDLETRAVAGASFEIQPGEFVAVMGRSGSGKSTLASLAGLLEAPTEGRLFFDGHEVTGWPAGRLAQLRRRQVGFVFQSFHLIPHLRAAQNVDLALDGLGLSRAERRTRVTDVLERLGVGSRNRHFPRQLSGGQQQRVALARALVRDPAILICDEPTGNLDIENSANVVSLLEEAHRGGATILIVTHDSGIAKVASRTLTMTDGVISE